MPKENINDCSTKDCRAVVSWSDGAVQLATTKGPAEPFEGHRVSLDRAGCNRAIRALRTARDRAFGADA